ncbi:MULTISPECIES: hypothetical protein [Actinoplanes]|uniref:hypothetical protein n=1 Tax=Actinoplanes TaxID=1865 RepID=UPI0005F290C9|nr:MULTISPECIES: hypothetical protein [Actinoplanes]GLY07822.1 hypothetical protein Acsp01_82010 [Actinoplanes sp. NBRC 101535]
MNHDTDGPRRVVATAADFSTAARASARLTEGGIPQDSATIVACGSHEAPAVTARRPAVRGGLLGLLVGILVGHLLTSFELVVPNHDDDTRIALAAAATGTASGAAIGLIGYGMALGRRPAGVPGRLRPDHYDLVVDATVADRATQVLAASSR